ncbi:amidohydrolase [Cryptococcus wingfieldii CBS 7118]|uniref:Amidohydrolase n=1 Tax=Cryptococcus wingfieldii CBS 7118 TaxID=1295528 RepID=A0A1E3I589_9TREE|nr:amidohydrolase [Cryptococcus wingfieldii CBS 7118]ODN83769.1 amidohydrolase [Cryptococcus wingfieldii CBS 7118]
MFDEFDFAKTFPNPVEVRESLLPLLSVKPWYSSASQDFYLTNVNVVDAASGSLLEGPQTIKVSRGVIVSVEPESAAQLDDQAKVYDFSGKFVCPGLIDAHVHVTAVPGVQTMADMVRLPSDTVALRATYVLKGMLQRGFTTVRDTGGANKILSDSIKEGLIEGPRLFQCGKAISQTGGHADFSPALSGGDGGSCCGGHSQSLGRVADGVPAVLKAVREELKQGADFIKIMLGGGVSSEYDAIETVQYSPEEVRAITSTCSQMGKRMATAHAYTVEAINHAIDNGVQGIEHGNLMDAPTAKRMAENGVYLTPTLSCYGIMLRKPFEGFLNEEQRDKSVQVMQQGLNALRIAEEAGVTVCYGSDLLNSMHALQTEEFTVRSTVLPSATLLKHATINPAKMLGYEGRLGVIAPGAFADILVLEKNPLEDITVLDLPEQHLLAVFKEGKLVKGGL